MLTSLKVLGMVALGTIHVLFMITCPVYFVISICGGSDLISLVGSDDDE